MTHESIESTSDPKSAGQKPSMVKLGTMSVIAQKSSALSIKENNPNVMIVMGSVKIVRMGRIVIVTIDHTSARRKAVSNPPLTCIPGTRLIVSKTAATVPR